MSQSSIKVLSLNCWGLKYIAKLRTLRINAIADQIAASDYDLVGLQEIWVSSEDWVTIRERCKRTLPYSKFFYSGAFGSGLALLSRFPITATYTHPYTLNGTPIHVQHGDWFVGKACGCATLEHPELGLVDVWNTHFIAAGGEGGPEATRSHRIAQAWELANNVRLSAERGRHVICLGDLNSTPPSLCIAILRDVGALTDAFLASHPSLPASATALPAPPNPTGDPRPDPARAVRELGVTCDSPLNTWTAGKPLDERARRGAGKRLDYIFFRGPASHTGGDASASPTGRLACESSSVVFTERVPGHDISFTDHFGLEAVFSVHANASKPPASNAHSRRVSSGAHDGTLAQTLTSSLHALAGGHRLAAAGQRKHSFLFAVALGLAISLLIGSIFQPLGGVNPVFVLLSVVAGWAGTTMLYSAVVWGEWEKRALRTMMEAMELELEQTRRLVSGVAGAGSRHSLDPSSPPNTAPSAGAGNGRSEQTNAEEGTLF